MDKPRLPAIPESVPHAGAPRPLRAAGSGADVTVAEARFDALWERHERQVIAHARREVARYGLADEDLHEVVQETRIALYEAIPRLGLFDLRSYLRGSLSSYLRGIVARRAADAARDRARRPMTTAADLGDDPEALETLLASEGDAEDVAMVVLDRLSKVATASQLRDAIERLPVKQREAIELVRLRGASYAEAAAVLGLAVGTVKSQVHDALKSLRRRAEAEEWGL